MRDLVILLVHVIVTLSRLLDPGGIRSVVAESVLVKQQLLILNRSRQRAPSLRASDRLVAGLCTLFLQPTRVICSTIVLKPATLLNFHQALRKRKYRILFSPKRPRKPGPKGPSRQLIDAIVDMKQRNPSWGCPRIAQQLALAFGVSIDKDIVRRVLATHYRPKPDSYGSSWLTFLGQMKDSLWSMDLFRCESATLRTHWILVVMDQYSRRIIGFGVHAGAVDGVALCRMFNHAIGGYRAVPKYLRSDHDPLFLFERWRANLRILDVAEIKTVLYVPLSHPFVERLIGAFVVLNKRANQSFNVRRRIRCAIRDRYPLDAHLLPQPFIVCRSTRHPLPCPLHSKRTTELTVLSVVVVQQELWLVLEAGIPDLLFRPLERWMIGYMRVDDLSARKLHDHENVKMTFV